MVSRYWEECTLNNLTHGLRYMLKHARPDFGAVAIAAGDAD